MATTARFSPAIGRDDPQLWLGASALMDLEDPKLRLRVQALTQLCKNKREKALAVYGYVKRLPLSRRFKTRSLTARQVYDAGRGDALDKATLLVAMFRIVGLPARIRCVTLSGEILRGIAPGMTTVSRPIVEVRMHDRWLRTDTYIFDASCMAAARQRLRDQGSEWGYGIHVNGHMVWNGYEDSFLGGVPTECDLMVIGEIGVFHDAADCVASPAFRRQHPPVQMLYWNVVAPLVDMAFRGLRDEPARPGTPSRKTS